MAKTKSSGLLKEILAAIDTNSVEIWDELSQEQRKEISFFPLMRFVSSISGPRNLQEHFLLLTNERLNKNFWSISKHTKLLWLLACSCHHDSKQINYHEYIRLNILSSKKEKLISELFPNMKLQDIRVLSSITTDQEIKNYCRDLGWDDSEINKIKI
jgi:hypothetical protein